MYDPANRPGRAKKLQENDQVRRLIAENAELKSEVATLNAELKAAGRKVAGAEALKADLLKARRQRNDLARRAEEARARAVAATEHEKAAESRERAALEEVRMCRVMIAELRTSNRMLQDRLVVACA